MVEVGRFSNFWSLEMLRRCGGGEWRWEAVVLEGKCGGRSWDDVTVGRYGDAGAWGAGVVVAGGVAVAGTRNAGQVWWWMADG